MSGQLGSWLRQAVEDEAVRQYVAATRQQERRDAILARQDHSRLNRAQRRAAARS